MSPYEKLLNFAASHFKLPEGKAGNPWCSADDQICLKSLNQPMIPTMNFTPMNDFTMII